MTPRPSKDTAGRPGQAPGLSTFETAPQAGKKYFMIDLDQLERPLKAISDEPALGGTKGHVAIAPVRDSGEIDQGLLSEWASSRGTDHKHRLTEIVENAIIPGELR